MDEWEEPAFSIPIAILKLDVSLLQHKLCLEFTSETDGLGGTLELVLSAEKEQIYLVNRPDKDANEITFYVHSYQLSPFLLLDEFIFSLGLNSSIVTWENETVGSSVWRMYSIDDNEVSYEMYRFCQKPVAEYMQMIFNNKGHQQKYYIEEMECLNIRQI